ncbi:putative fluoride ion transporter CrcB [Enterobacter asburiae]|nr:putative fluoride ion transporter CrcB [Enterobacter asburiae]
MGQLSAIMIGGAVGCVIRWFFGFKLNSFFPSLPPGTLVVNLLGAFIIGAAMAYFMRNPQLDPAWKLLIVTGLCGGLTTFSTFSVEVFTLLQAGNYSWALGSVLVHVAGSLLMTAAGFYLITLLI